MGRKKQSNWCTGQKEIIKLLHRAEKECKLHERAGMRRKSCEGAERGIASAGAANETKTNYCAGQ